MSNGNCVLVNVPGPLILVEVTSLRMLIYLSNYDKVHMFQGMNMCVRHIFPSKLARSRVSSITNDECAKIN